MLWQPLVAALAQALGRQHDMAWSTVRESLRAFQDSLLSGAGRLPFAGATPSFTSTVLCRAIVSRHTSAHWWGDDEWMTGRVELLDIRVVLSPVECDSLQE